MSDALPRHMRAWQDEPERADNEPDTLLFEETGWIGDDPRAVACPCCDGSGVTDIIDMGERWQPVQCRNCDGSGYVRLVAS